MNYKEITIDSGARHLVCGDIHGYYDDLMLELERLKFSDSDTLFLLGDMVNRGSQNIEMIELLRKSNVHAIAGNHELSILDYGNGSLEEKILVGRGGQWFVDLPDDEKTKVIAVLTELPLAMKVTTTKGSTRGLVHAACPAESWDELAALMKAKEPRRSMVVRTAISDRASFNNQLEKTTAGIDWVIVGHNPVEKIGCLGNTMYLDCGLYLGGKLKVMDLIRMSVV